MYMKPYLQYLFYPKTVLVPSFSWTSRIDKSHSGADIAIQWYGVLLPVILNGAAGGVKDLGERNNAFILCGYGEVYQILR